jgi:DNA-binding response OmpR family regulator
MPPLHETVRRVLVVDDDLSILELVRTRLTLAGYMVLAARNGAEALTRLNERRYDAMVLDLNMPEVDGFQVLERVRRLGFAPPPTLVLTARHDASDVHHAIRLGARDYLTKPFQDRQLLMRVARLFRRQPPKVDDLLDIEIYMSQDVPAGAPSAPGPKA